MIHDELEISSGRSIRVSITSSCAQDSGENDFQGYREQPVERDAREFGSKYSKGYFRQQSK